MLLRRDGEKEFWMGKFFDEGRKSGDLSNGQD